MHNYEHPPNAGSKKTKTYNPLVLKGGAKQKCMGKEKQNIYPQKKKKSTPTINLRVRERSTQLALALRM